MLKYVIVWCAAVALMQQTEAFKVITIQKGAPVSAPAVDTNALLQGVQSAITAKLQQVQGLVGSLIQQKIALKQTALNSIQSTLVNLKSQVASLAGNVQPPILIQKRIYIGVGKPAAAAPDATATNEVDDTTSSR